MTGGRMRRTAWTMAGLVLAAPAAADPAEDARRAFDGFLAEAAAIVPDCTVLRPTLTGADAPDDCVLLTYARIGAPSSATVVIERPDETVRLTVEGDDWPALRTALTDCLRAWVDTGEATCAPVDWRARHAALRAEHDALAARHDRLVESLRRIGLIVFGGGNRRGAG